MSQVTHLDNDGMCLSGRVETEKTGSQQCVPSILCQACARADLGETETHGHIFQASSPEKGNKALKQGL